ncbi:MAG TPA: QueT transporter family protein [Halanaerobiaceae bacterium]|jgi:uncharacterized membrane protein|nr:QueT transporter family protein [Bacillota bacterium]HHU92209.1 QueT transporter family protein [Halanaerobiaceae bacterium]HOA40288.1 QueT transporter family protein [Halanaerobiales bacterium]HPZ62344.1 QueT transporter family protein [Halanaerobiales bacterium]HQD03180.1 QueT transporter family protein [Halanaerobiales bacterium]
MKLNVKEITKLALIAAIYVVITLALAPISFGGLQVRISEALTLLPFFLGAPAAIALWIGCMLANYVGGLGIIDIVLGSALTLIAGLLTARARNMYIAGIYPVAINAFGVAFILYYTLELPYWLSVLQVGVGQFISVYIIGFLLVRIINKYDLFTKD